jgi:DeoR/GlpR family transcriptional regulator of sugar metabolism
MDVIETESFKVVLSISKRVNHNNYMPSTHIDICSLAAFFFDKSFVFIDSGQNCFFIILYITNQKSSITCYDMV